MARPAQQGLRRSVAVLEALSPVATVAAVHLLAFLTPSREYCWETAEVGAAQRLGLAAALEAVVQASPAAPAE